MKEAIQTGQHTLCNRSRSSTAPLKNNCTHKGRKVGFFYYPHSSSVSTLFTTDILICGDAICRNTGLFTKRPAACCRNPNVALMQGGLNSANPALREG